LRERAASTTNPPHHDDDETRVRRFLESGAEVVGSLAGAGLGTLIGGPVGTVMGAVAPTIVMRSLQRSIGEVMQRELGKREQARISGALLVAAEQITHRLHRGESPRQDGFFDPRNGRRPDADEIAEGVVRAAQREHEERKVAHLGYLIATIYFDADISLADANALLRQADALTYRQLLLIALVKRTEDGKPSERCPSPVPCRGVEASTIGRYAIHCSDGVRRSRGSGASWLPPDCARGFREPWLEHDAHRHRSATP